MINDSDFTLDHLLGELGLHFTSANGELSSHIVGDLIMGIAVKNNGDCNSMIVGPNNQMMVEGALQALCRASCRRMDTAGVLSLLWAVYHTIMGELEKRPENIKGVLDQYLRKEGANR